MNQVAVKFFVNVVIHVLLEFAVYKSLCHSTSFISEDLTAAAKCNEITASIDDDAQHL